MSEDLENIFRDGAIATGDSFIGREEELLKLESMIFEGKGAVHLVGPTRIGKSSLVREACRRYSDPSKHLLVEIIMGELVNAQDFWLSLSTAVREDLENADKWNPEFEKIYGEIKNLDPADSEWYIKFRPAFHSVLKQIVKVGCKLVLIIDEFDSVVRIFEKFSYYYQFLRSIYSEARYVVSGIIISRRRLHLLEQTCEHISSFHGVFSEMPLHAFSDLDMKAFYENLALYEVEVLPDGRERLDYYTGRLPHLCCRFAWRMVHKKLAHPFGGDDIRNIFRECLPQIDRHYEDLKRRLKEDGYLDFIFYLSIGAKVPSERDLESMIQMGVLATEQNDKATRYYSFSKDFMTYLRAKPVDLPAWDLIMSCEKKLKAIFNREYPELDRVTYNDLRSSNASTLCRRVERQYPALNPNWEQILVYCRELSDRKENPTVLDVLTLSKVISVIISEWTRFLRHFNGDPEWKTKLLAIKNVRNPMAHAKLEYISDQELAVCLKYCDEIIRLN